MATKQTPPARREVPKTRRISDLLKGRFGQKWLVGEQYIITSARIEDSVYDGKPSNVAVFTTTELKEDKTPLEIFAGSDVVVGQVKDLLALEASGEPVFPLSLVLGEVASRSSKFKYQELQDPEEL